MKKFVAKWVGIAAIVAASLTGCDSSSFYQTAQRQTVLLTVPNGQGSGVVIRREGPQGTRLFVWTAAHVVEGFSAAQVGFFIREKGRRVGEVRFNAVVVARDDVKDIALLWLDAPAEYFEFAEFDTEIDRPGEAQFHVGNFYGNAYDGSISSGVLSQVGLTHPEWPGTTPMDHSTCVVVPGSSGGPIFNRKTRKVEGLVLGGKLGITVYFPAREIRKWAKENSVVWAIDDHWCPADDVILELAKKATPTVVIQIFSVK